MTEGKKFCQSCLQSLTPGHWNRHLESKKHAKNERRHEERAKWETARKKVRGKIKKKTVAERKEALRNYILSEMHRPVIIDAPTWYSVLGAAFPGENVIRLSGIAGDALKWDGIEIETNSSLENILSVIGEKINKPAELMNVRQLLMAVYQTASG